MELFYLIFLSMIGSVTMVWTIPFIIFKVLGVSLFVVKDQQKIDKILKILDNKILTTMYNYQYGEMKKSGFIFSFSIIGYVHEKLEEDKTIQILYILMSKKHFQKISKEEDDDTKVSVVVDTKIDTFVRDGAFWRPYYEKHTILFNDIDPNFHQQKIMDDIVTYYQKNQYCTAFINGIPGSGKTTIAYFLAKRLNGSLCKTFKPYEPGDSLIKLIDRASPTKEKPLVILFDEVNILMRKIHDQLIERHKNIPIQIQDKTSFNTFLDDMKYNKNIILLMTSNESKEQLDVLDSSYLRKGRVDVYASV